MENPLSVQTRSGKHPWYHSWGVFFYLFPSGLKGVARNMGMSIRTLFNRYRVPVARKN